ncbi:hypothetical protein LOC54_06360 [Acetobacter sp. AN02]|uniref:hypothetical protein n=1 Tax=Acetobacter sp. AN02 TaxID=2894186 RepID=UPI0024345B38|nr:hypothetical protein [Acetobacter sp. AN02]MDG6094733.1 hypothetical protein [Acetobacter sp. AN02]
MKACIRPILIILSSVLLCACVVSCLMLPYMAVDTPFYTLIGRSMLHDQILPYRYIFDHKPLFGFLLYGLWDSVMPVKTGMFTILALVCAAATSAVARAIWKTGGITLFLILIAAGTSFEILSGNTESFQILLQISILSLLRTSSLPGIFATGIATLLTININYLTAVCLFAPVLFLLLTRPSPVKRTASFSAGFIAGAALLFSPYLLHDPQALADYFRQQRNFLHAYGADSKERLLTLRTAATWLAFFVPPLALWIRKYIVRVQGKISRDDLLLLIWFLSGLPAACLSGHAFAHYNLLWFTPVAIMTARLLQDSLRPAGLRIALIPAILLTGFSLVQVTADNIKKYKRFSHIDYRRLSSLTHGEPVLNIRAREALFYLANMKTADPYLFREHIDIVFGPHAAEHYLRDLSRNPPFVLLTWDGCGNGKIEAPVCAYLRAHYRKAESVKITSRSGKIHSLSFDLYRYTSDAASLNPQPGASP